MEKYLLSASGSRFSDKDKRQAPEKRQRPNTTPPDQGKKTKKFIPNPEEVEIIQGAPTHNRFGVLPVDDEDPELLQKATKRKAGNNTPPVIIELSSEWTHQRVRDILNKYAKDFHMTCRGRKLVRVQCYSAKSHQDLKEGLTKENVAFHTFTRKDEKQPKAVIKGLPKFLMDQIPAELASLGFPGTTATEIKTHYPSDCPPVLVQVPAGTNMAKLKSIRYLSNCSIQVERFKPSKSTGTQCFRCQSFGHASRNCNRPPRCVKCTLSHPTWECTKQDREAPAKCCNCEQDHPANFSKCPERLKYVDRIESRRDKLRKTLGSDREHIKPQVYQTWANVVSVGATKKKSNTFNVQPTVHPDKNQARSAPSPSTFKSSIMERTPLTLPSLNKPTVQIQAQPTQHTGAQPTPNTHDYDAMEMLEILATMSSLKQEFSKCKTFLDKVILIMTHLGHYV